MTQAVSHPTDVELAELLAEVRAQLPRLRRVSPPRDYWEARYRVERALGRCTSCGAAFTSTLDLHHHLDQDGTPCVKAHVQRIFALQFALGWHGYGFGCYRHQCRTCGVVFYAKVKHARFCGPICKRPAIAATAKRWRQRHHPVASDRACVVCGGPLPAHCRRDTRTCRNACRQTAWRRRGTVTV